MKHLTEILGELSLVCANFGDGLTLRDVLQDWFAFLGGRPGEVVVLDNGSDSQTRQASLDCFAEGTIDKLLLIRPGHPDTPKERAHLAEHTAPSIASKRYLLFFKFDTLPYRDGREHWLVKATECLDRADTFAVGGSFNVMSKHHEGPWPGWYFSHKCSENFALMKREIFIRAMEEYAGQYISSGFRTTNPGSATGQDRYLIELAWERYIEKHQVYTLVQEEDPSWTVFHTNVHGERLGKVRTDYLARKQVTKFLNAGCSGARPPGIYYGQPSMDAWLARLREQFGGSAMGPYWRAIKRSLALKARG
ncbi:MAG TPA: hypothetical protein VNZ22_12185 [Bacillota bacterium]|nr:hypothetical protein [Bacillota bacterium]